MQHLVAGESYSVKDVPLLEVLIDIRLGEGGIGPKVPAHSSPLVAGQDWLQYVPPLVCTMYVPRHAAQKPVECMERPIRNHEGDVYDPFVGSGTTIIAAERQDRTCYAMELEPGYVDAAVKRWEDYTGGKATRVKGDTR